MSRAFRVSGGTGGALLLVAAVGAAQVTEGSAEEPGGELRRLEVADVYGADEDQRLDFEGSVPSIEWLDDEHWIQRTEIGGAEGEGDSEDGAEEGGKRRRYEKVNARSGASEPLFDHDALAAALAAVPGVEAAAAKKSAYGALRWNEGHTLALLHLGEDLFLARFDGAAPTVERLTFDPQEEVGEEFSPDGRFVSFVRGGDLFLLDLESGRERPLTSGGSDELLFGRLDWVYQEEIYGRGNFKGYWWSPDSRRIALLRFDESPVREFTVVDHIEDPPKVEVTNYPKAGDPNPIVTLGVIPVVGGEARWLDTGSYASSDHLIVSVGWDPDGDSVVFQVQDREQRWLHLLSGDPESGEIELLLEETSPAFVQALGEPRWLEDGGFLWLSERSGFQHLYRYDVEGELVAQLTSGEWEIRSFLALSESQGRAYFLATKDDPIAPQLYSVGLEAPDGVERISSQRGSHAVELNQSASLYYDRWSHLEQPTRAAVFTTAGEQVRVVDDGELEDLAGIAWGSVERLQVPTRDGFMMEALLIKPPDFDPSRRYPVLQYNYGGPHAPVVRDAWGGRRWAWHQLLAQRGVVIWMCDNRSASGKGIAPVYEAYQRMGELELRDIEDGLDWLAKQPWVDAERIGIWGWSYGGFMAAYALTHSQRFAAGIAGAPVTDWRYYDTVYTERYMRRPQANPEGYAATSVVESAADLHGELLLIHGTIDDNVHLQNSMQLAYALQKAGRQFELMLYPKARHGVRDAAQEEHLYTLMTDFVLRTLRPGAGPETAASAGD
ncbi:MAG: S9 family peptidase [Acidobacteria bacterium]|nr:MAG: S9 family peptidase [Acidobacteriota bacterium]REK00843.1 MAG: S9 family peptidase [Acidobacteriota bacterium]